MDIVVQAILRGKAISLNRDQFFYSIILLFYYLLFFVSLAYTASPKYSYEKVYLFLPCILSFFYGLFIVKIDLKLLYKLYLILFLPSAVWFLIGRNIYYTPLNRSFFNESFLLINTNYLNYGVGVAIMILLNIYLKKNKLLLLSLFLVLLGLGSRGSLLFLLLILLFWKIKPLAHFFMLNFRINRRKIPYIFTSFLALFVLGAFYGKKIVTFIEVGIYRFQSLLQFSEDKSSTERIDALGFAFNDIFGSLPTFLIGNGIGSYGILYNGLDKREYPHNIFVEAWFELGLLGLLLLLILLISPFFLFKDKKQMLFLLIFSFLLLNAMKTGDMVSIWTTYALSGILIFKVNGRV
ncbi:O-antigen ligase family protein [Flagellimonas sp.]|uniref:O-antigen ligase family protein n=1 Tax=Flagellimonas sp. TaxID=2058762 RepID=UPI003AB37003